MSRKLENLRNVVNVEPESREIVSPGFAAAVRDIKKNDKARDKANELRKAPKEGEEVLPKDLKINLEESLFTEWVEEDNLNENVETTNESIISDEGKSIKRSLLKGRRLKESKEEKHLTPEEATNHVIDEKGKITVLGHNGYLGCDFYFKDGSIVTYNFELGPITRTQEEFGKEKLLNHLKDLDKDGFTIIASDDIEDTKDLHINNTYKLESLNENKKKITEEVELKPIKEYSWSLTDDGILEVYITDKNGNEKILATLTDCGNMKDFELDNLAQEVIEENDYFVESLKESYNGDIEKDLQTYCDLLLKDYNEDGGSRDITYTFKKGGKYYKIISNTSNQYGESVHAFVDEDGNVYKPAGWRAPAKGVRARLEDIVSGKRKVDWAGGYLYSSRYMGENLKENSNPQRTLYFTQIVDDRFDKDLEKTMNQHREEIISKLSEIDGVKVHTDKVREVNFDSGTKQLRQDYFVQKDTRKVSWNDIYAIINSVKAVPYKFISNFRMPSSTNENLKEDWTHFEFKSGANPYIAKTEKEKERMLKKYGDKVKEVKKNFYIINDKNLKEELGDYVNEPYCEEIANRLEDGFWNGYTENDTEWELDVNGLSRSEFAPAFADWLAENISYPVRDGHLSFMDLDMFIAKNSIPGFHDADDAERLVPDLIKLGIDREDIDEWLKNPDVDEELEFWVDYDTNFDIDEWEKNNLDLPDEVTYDFYSLVDNDVDINSDDYNLDDVIADRLSDDYGYTHLGFEYDVDKDSGDVYVYDIKWDLSESLKESYPEEKTYKVSFGTGTYELHTETVKAFNEQEAADKAADQVVEKGLEGLYADHYELMDSAETGQSVDEYVAENNLIALGNNGFYFDLQNIEEIK